jgi:hypothetical protein
LKLGAQSSYFATQPGHLAAQLHYIGLRYLTLDRKV